MGEGERAGQRWTVPLASAAAALALAVGSASAQAGDAPLITGVGDQIEVVAGESTELSLSRPAARAAVGDRDAASAVLVTSTALRITGKRAPDGGASAETSLIVWDKQGRAEVRRLVVRPTTPTAAAPADIPLLLPMEAESLPSLEAGDQAPAQAGDQPPQMATGLPPTAAGDTGAVDAGDPKAAEAGDARVGADAAGAPDLVAKAEPPESPPTDVAPPPPTVVAQAVPEPTAPARVEAPRVAVQPRPTGGIIDNFAHQIDVPAGQSVIVNLSRSIDRVAIADPEVADVVLVSPREILINGRGRRHTSPSGELVVQEAQTSLVVWDKEGRPEVKGLYVNRSRTEQIELRVTVAELNRNAFENQGFDFRIFQGGMYFASTPSKIATASRVQTTFIDPVPSGPLAFGQDLDLNRDRVTFTLLDLNNNFQAFIELLQREALAKVLARPTLLARSGEEAHFRAGGEIPIPLVTNNQLAVQFKEFGAIVDFTPSFTDDGRVDLKVSAELSEPDLTLSRVETGGFVVPGFKSRQANTRVRLRDGQSLLIAGLMREDELEDERKVPYLGDVPYLGAFFRTTNFERRKTELLILVQPRVISAERDDTQLALPTTRGPLTRSEVRTKMTPYEVTRPRLVGPQPKNQFGWDAPPEPPAMPRDNMGGGWTEWPLE